MSKRSVILLEDLERNGTQRPPEIETAPVPKKRVRGLTPGQRVYLDAINTSMLVLCGGVAGTGKTHIPVARAMELLIEGHTKKIVIARPAVECGEKLGALPGDLGEKFDPYLRPIYDVMHDVCDPKKVANYVKDGIIEFCPLAFMRGRTFNESILILDEAQNATREQLKMFMTRLGNNARAIMSGDVSQCDLDKWRQGSYQFVIDLFGKQPYIDGIQIVTLTEDDVVRSGIVQKIVKRFGTAGIC